MGTHQHQRYFAKSGRLTLVVQAGPGLVQFEGGSKSSGRSPIRAAQSRMFSSRFQPTPSPFGVQLLPVSHPNPPCDICHQLIIDCISGL